MMNKEELLLLMERISDGTANEEEIAQYNSWCDGFRGQELEVPDMETIRAEMLAVIHQRIGEDRRTVRLWPKIAVAAAIAIVISGVYFFTTYRDSGVGMDDALAQYAKNDIVPGKNGATITLANGEVIELSDAKNGVVIGDSLIYSDGSDVRSLIPSELQGADGKGGQLLTASTSRGQTYQVTLPDGTKVWLNAASNIKFPSKFSGGERKILLDGEAYFEVAKDKAHPFIVKTRLQEVQVLGTHFNVNSYADEIATKTTLVEGSVRVRSFNSAVGATTAVLKPNQQLISNDSGSQVLSVDPEEFVSWKNAYFRFNGEQIESIMKKLERWYNIEVVYEGKATTETFTGTMSRNKNISQVLVILEKTKGVHFKIEGRR